MDINFFKDFENVTQYILKESEIFKKQQDEIFKIAQIQTDIFKNESLLFESTIQNLFKESEFLKKQQEISNIVMNQSFSSITSIANEISKIAQIQVGLLKNESSIFENVTQQLLNNKNFSENSFNIKYEDIETINKKIEQKEAFTKKDLATFDRIISIISLLFAFYVYYFPDETESIKIQQMINNLDNEISKSLKQELHYEVTKQVNIRELADLKSKKIAFANPKQKLLIIQNKPYWLQIEYFDEIKNETIIGWISKKYTKRLDF